VPVLRFCDSFAPLPSVPILQIFDISDFAVSLRWCDQLRTNAGKIGDPAQNKKLKRKNCRTGTEAGTEAETILVQRGDGNHPGDIPLQPSGFVLSSHCSSNHLRLYFQ